MQPRRFAPPPELEYFLDCATEGAEIDSCSSMTLRLYASDADMSAIIDAPRTFVPQSHYRNRRAMCLELAGLADRIMAELPEQRRSGLIRMGLQGIAHAVGDLAETMANWTIEDEIEGGCMVPFRRRLNSKNGVPFKNTARRLYAPRFIRRYVKRNAPEHADHLLVLNALMLRRARETAPARDDGIMGDYRAQLNNARQRMHHHVMAQFRKPITGPDRKMIRRSLAFAVSLLGRDTVSAFVRGEQIRLIGTDAMLMLRKRGSLTEKGHGCMSVAIADKNGTTLADLCTYIEDTPLLDQLSGFALWMQAGEERRVLETANIIQLADGANDHPLIAERRELIRAREQTAPPMDVEAIIESFSKHKKPRRFVRQLSHEETRERNRQYWEATKAEWLAAMYVFVIGYRNFPIYDAAHVDLRRLTP